jgi:N-acetylmuramoyl-L-alanine amidase
MKRICIDPGHGLVSGEPRRFDPGAVFAQVHEADIVMEYASRLRLACLKAGLEVFMTRRTNEDVAPLSRRVARAREAGADMLVSIHCNAAVSAQAHGTETLYKVSKNFASDLQRATVSALGLRDRGIKPRPGLAMLQFPGPCSLIELGFITNEDDRTVLLKAGRAEKFADAIVDALNEGDWT